MSYAVRAACGAASRQRTSVRCVRQDCEQSVLLAKLQPSSAHQGGLSGCARCTQTVARKNSKHTRHINMRRLRW